MTQNFLPLLADRILDRPLMIHPGKAETILSVLEGRISVGEIDATVTDTAEASRFKGGSKRADGSRTRFVRVQGNTALISVTGSLVNRGAWVGASSGLTSYEGLAAQIDEIAGDRSIRNAVLDIDSFGGEATGMVTLASKIRALRKRKRVVAVVNDVAASAGYAIASSAHEIAISPTSLVGSIGIVMLHVDRSGEMQSRGLRPTIIHAGEKKADGNPFAPLPENVRADMQRDVMAMYDQFLKLVEAGRTKRRLSAEKARKTEADVYTGQGAIDAGLADRMATLDDILAELSRPARAAGTTQNRRHQMFDDDETPGASAGKYSETAYQAAVTKAEENGKTVGVKEGKAEGHAEGVKAENERIGAILNAEEAKARPNAARKLALAPERFSAETAKSLLADMPEETAAKAEGDGGSKAQGSGAQTIEQRSQADAEIGAQSEGGAPNAEALRAGFKSATDRLNARR